MGCGGVPIKRAQDSVKKGSGSVTIEGLADNSSDMVKLVGNATKFLEEIKVGDKICFPQAALAVTVASIDSNESLSLKIEEGVLGVLSSQSFPEYVAFDVLPHIDQKDMFTSVLEKLASGGTICIFPEGGSHGEESL